jgi:hypothetical protein
LRGRRSSCQPLPLEWVQPSVSPTDWPLVSHYHSKRVCKLGTSCTHHSWRILEVVDKSAVAQKNLRRKTESLSGPARPHPRPEAAIKK